MTEYTAFLFMFCLFWGSDEVGLNSFVFQYYIRIYLSLYGAIRLSWHVLMPMMLKRHPSMNLYSNLLATGVMILAYYRPLEHGAKTKERRRLALQWRSLPWCVATRKPRMPPWDVYLIWKCVCRCDRKWAIGGIRTYSMQLSSNADLGDSTEMILWVQLLAEMFHSFLETAPVRYTSAPLLFYFGITPAELCWGIFVSAVESPIFLYAFCF